MQPCASLTGVFFAGSFATQAFFFLRFWAARFEFYWPRFVSSAKPIRARCVASAHRRRFPTMNRLNKSQKDKVRRFAAVAVSDEKTAIAVLKSKEVGWDLEVGLETFFTSPSSAFSSGGTNGSVNPKTLEATYASYRAPTNTHDEDIIDAGGIEKLCADIGIDPVDPVILVVAWKMTAKSMGVFLKCEFMTGMTAMECDTIAKLKAKIPTLRNDLASPSTFKEVFEYSFDFAKEPSHKSLPLETALGMFQVLLSERWDLCDAWCTFLEKEHGKAVTRDTWTQLLEFSKNIGKDMSGYDPAGAWPYLIDEFVEHMMERQN